MYQNCHGKTPLGLHHPQNFVFPQLASVKKTTLRIILESFKDTLKIFVQNCRINTTVRKMLSIQIFQSNLLNGASASVMKHPAKPLARGEERLVKEKP